MEIKGVLRDCERRRNKQGRHLRDERTKGGKKLITCPAAKEGHLPTRNSTGVPSSASPRVSLFSVARNGFLVINGVNK